MSYDLYSFPNPSGMAKLTAVSAPNACTLNSAQETSPWPRLRIIAGWTGIWGPGAEARVANVTARASGSELVVHELRNAHGVLTGYRVYARHATNGATIVSSSGTVMRSIPQGQFSDLLFGMTGNVASTTDPVAFDKDTTPGSEGIVDTIDAAKQAAGLD